MMFKRPIMAAAYFIVLMAMLCLAPRPTNAMEKKEAPLPSSFSFQALTAYDFSLPRPSAQQSQAFLIGGTYDFDLSEEDTMGFMPYLAGGLGLQNTTQDQNDAMPVFRLGGGIAYRLGPQWNLSLDYQTKLTPRDTSFTGRSQEVFDLETLNMGMKLKF